MQEANESSGPSNVNSEASSDDSEDSAKASAAVRPKREPSGTASIGQNVSRSRILPRKLPVFPRVGQTDSGAAAIDKRTTEGKSVAAAPSVLVHQHYNPKRPAIPSQQDPSLRRFSPFLPKRELNLKAPVQGLEHKFSTASNNEVLAPSTSGMNEFKLETIANEGSRSTVSMENLPKPFNLFHGRAASKIDSSPDGHFCDRAVAATVPPREHADSSSHDRIDSTESNEPPDSSEAHETPDFPRTYKPLKGLGLEPLNVLGEEPLNVLSQELLNISAQRPIHSSSQESSSDLGDHPTSSQKVPDRSRMVTLEMYQKRVQRVKVPWRGWTRGPALLSKLAARAVLRKKLCDMVPPNLLELHTEYSMSGRQVKNYSKMDQLLCTGRPADVHFPYEIPSTEVKKSSGFGERARNRLKKSLFKGRGGWRYPAEYSEALNNIVAVCRPLRWSEEWKKRRFMYCLKGEKPFFGNISVWGSRLYEDLGNEYEAVFADMPEFDASKLTVFLVTLFARESRVTLVQWKDGKECLPPDVSVLFTEILPAYPEGYITELRIVNVPIKDPKAFEKLLSYCEDHLVLLECSSQSREHLKVLADHGDGIRDLTLVGQPSTLSEDDFVEGFFDADMGHFCALAEVGMIKFPCKDLRSLHLIRVINFFQAYYLSCMAMNSENLINVKSDYHPIPLNNCLSSVGIGTQLEEMYVNGKDLKSFLKQHDMKETFPTLKHLHFSKIDHDSMSTKDFLQRAEWEGITFHFDNSVELESHWPEKLFPSFQNASRFLKTLGIEVTESLSYDFVWALLRIFRNIESFTLDYSARAIKGLGVLFTDLNLDFLLHLCYRKTDDARYSPFTGRLLCLIFLAAPNLRRIELRITHLEYLELLRYVLSQDVELPNFNEFAVHVPTGGLDYVQDVVWMLDRFPSITTLRVLIDRDVNLAELRRRLRRTSVQLVIEVAHKFI